MEKMNVLEVNNVEIRNVLIKWRIVLRYGWEEEEWSWKKSKWEKFYCSKVEFIDFSDGNMFEKFSRSFNAKPLVWFKFKINYIFFFFLHLISTVWNCNFERLAANSIMLR